MGTTFLGHFNTFTKAAKFTALAIGLSAGFYIGDASADTFKNSRSNVKTASIMNVPSFGTYRDRQDKLFGATEQRSSNLRAFKKWNIALDRADSESSRADWKRDIQRFSNLSKREQVDRVNSYVNGFRYIEDRNNYGTSDYWATPSEFFARGGDCEDFALTKYHALQELGFSKNDMRMVILQDEQKGVPHAVLVVYLNGERLILDNQIKSTVNDYKISHYRPIYSINESNWWRHSQT